MRKLLLVVVILGWALWLGGMVALLMFVTQLFKASRTVAFDAAPVLFRTFANYQLLIGTIACAGGTVLAMLTRRKVYALMTLLMLGALASAILIRGWTGRMDALRHAGQSAGAEFKSLHAKSSIGYTTSAGLLLIAGVGFTLAASSRQTAPQTSPATDSPGEAVGRS